MSATKAAAAASEQAVEQQVSEQSLLDQIVAQGRFTRDASTMEHGRDIVKEFIAQVLDGQLTLSRDAEASIQAQAPGEAISNNAVVYLNRLSDALFVWSRWASHTLGVPEILWEPNRAASGQRDDQS